MSEPGDGRFEAMVEASRLHDGCFERATLTGEYIAKHQAEAVAAERQRLRTAIEAEEFTHWHHATGGTSPNAWDNDRDGVFVDRAAVLALLEDK